MTNASMLARLLLAITPGLVVSGGVILGVCLASTPDRHAPRGQAIERPAAEEIPSWQRPVEFRSA